MSCVPPEGHRERDLLLRLERLDGGAHFGDVAEADLPPNSSFESVIAWPLLLSTIARWISPASPPTPV
jgi:hypothetical protein